MSVNTAFWTACRLSLSSVHEDKLSEIMKIPTVRPRHVVRFMISALWVRLQLRRKERLSLCGAFDFTSASREDERVRVWASSAALRPPRPRLSEFIWSDVSPPSVFLERMRLLVFATLCGVLLDSGRCKLERLRPLSLHATKTCAYVVLKVHIPSVCMRNVEIYCSKMFTTLFITQSWCFFCLYLRSDFQMGT